MKTFIDKSGNTMVKAGSLNWLRESVYAGETTAPYFYRIYVGGMAEGHSCVYTEEDKILSIANIAYSSDDPALKFKIYGIDAASIIVETFAKGMEIELEGTIYKQTLKIKL